MKTHKDLYRDPEKGKIAGVCAGLADYFGMELWLVRIIFVSAFFLTAGTFVLVSYVAAWFILEKKDAVPKANRDVPFQTSFKKHGKGWHNTPEEDKVVVKSKIWQAGEPPKQAFFDIQQRFAKNESRLRKVESYVTSAEFQLNREINQL
ncbi:MAG: envelope stress response membrane protein PspC [Paraglaciecola sp.]|nr:envelope stress response membrane protein PspC [Paraglaciecola sp.]NCT46632.1 envelope stress response membrane protein PspC [Paraglaciecola sp.]